MKLPLFDSKLFGRICYGYKRNANGIIETIDEEANVIRKIFSKYLNGSSLEAGVPSPSGKSKWSRDVLNKILNNSKYLNYIIPSEIFVEVQIIKSENCRNPNEPKII